MEEPHASQTNIDQVPSVTTGANQSTGITLLSSLQTASVHCTVNGTRYEIGDAVKTKDFYFSSDGGTTAKDFDNVLIGDTLYWTKYREAFDLDAGDLVSIHHATIGR